jgi:hypothetical protein
MHPTHLKKVREMDNIQNWDSYINIPSSQAYRPYLRFMELMKTHNEEWKGMDEVKLSYTSQ